jgi:hypothetical protein
VSAELTVIEKCVELLVSLNYNQRIRVANYLFDRFGDEADRNHHSPQDDSK